MTTKDKVNKAFRLLRSAGYFAKQKFWCCQSCAWSAVPDNTEKVVFYHEQDADAWNDEGELESPLYLAWSGNAKEICNILSSCDLLVEHDGGEDSRIKIMPKPIKFVSLKADVDNDPIYLNSDREQSAEFGL